MSHYNPHLLPKVRSDIMLRAIGRMPCTLRIASFVPGLTCSHRDTVIPAHIASIGKSMGSKVTDSMVVASCLCCHDLLDQRDKRGIMLMEKYPSAVLQRVICAIAETQSILVAIGVIKIKGAEHIKGKLPVGFEGEQV